MEFEFTGVSLVGGALWTVANATYIRLRSSGRGGLSRVLAFWLGLPTTWVTLVFVREGTPMLEDDEAEQLAPLLREVRADRARRQGGDTLPDGSGGRDSDGSTGALPAPEGEPGAAGPPTPRDPTE